MFYLQIYTMLFIIIKIKKYDLFYKHIQLQNTIYFTNRYNYKIDFLNIYNYKIEFILH